MRYTYVRVADDWAVLFRGDQRVWENHDLSIEEMAHYTGQDGAVEIAYLDRTDLQPWLMDVGGGRLPREVTLAQLRDESWPGPDPDEEMTVKTTRKHLEALTQGQLDDELRDAARAALEPAS